MFKIQRIMVFTALLLAMPLSVFAASQRVSLKFDALVGKDAFACGQSYDNIGVTHSRITPSDMRFFVSEVELLDAKGRAVAVKLDQDGIWQHQNLALMDFEDGTGPCRNGNSGLHTAVTGSVPKGNYRGVRFTLGVPFGLNHGDPTIAPSPLNISGMFWVWQSGYKFVKIDMATNGQPQAADQPADVSMKERVAAMEKVAAMKKDGVAPMKMPARAAGFSVHLGSTACASSSLTAPPSECQNPNRVTITFDRFDANKNVIIADVTSLLQDANVDVNAPDSAPGCMSGTNDADCISVMPSFGLPFNDQPALPQRFFRMR